MSKSKSKQFTDPLLVEVYDSINALGEDADFWLRETEKLDPQSIIDFGCGTGLLTCVLAERGYEVVGIDPAEPMMNWRKKSSLRIGSIGLLEITTLSKDTVQTFCL